MVYKLTPLMPDLPGDLVDETGKHVDYEGIVFRADEVYAVIDRLEREAARWKASVMRMGLSDPQMAKMIERTDREVQN